MIKKISFLGLLFLVSNTIFSQSEAIKTSYSISTSGYIDAYFRSSFSTQSGFTNNYTSFTNSQNKLALGMASFKMDQTLGKWGSTIDLGYGKRAEEFSYNDQGLLANIKQAFISYAITDKLKISAGKWATHVGYELLDAPLNRNYSMSYGFSYGPFFHTGVKAEYALSGKTSFMIGLANPTDYVTSKSSSKVFIAQWSTKLFQDKTSLYVNYQGGNVGGSDQFSQIDVVINNTLSSQWALNYDGTIYSAKMSGKTSDWKSNALYLNFDPNSTIGFTLRSEIFDDKSALSAGAFGTSLFANTLSMNYKFKKLTIIPEFRWDNAKDNIFTNSSSKATGSNASFVLAAVYKF
jgi:Putative beta-barrel porin-2, OmpL-like. bbp2